MPIRSTAARSTYPPTNVTAAVRWLVDHAEADGIGVVVVGFDVEGDAALERAVRELVRRGRRDRRGGR